mgnify:CR=1 FL=1
MFFFVEVSVWERAPYGWQGVQVHVRAETAIADARRLLDLYPSVRVRGVEGDLVWSHLQGKEIEYV